MIKNNIKTLDLYTFDNLSHQAGIQHFVTPKTGGFGEWPYDSLNLGLHVNDNEENVLKNRKHLADTLGIPLNHFIFADQVHGDNITIITENEKGMGTSNLDTAIPETDGMITNVHGICLMVLVADCVPLLFYDPVKKVVGASHAGWKGTIKLIGKKTVEAMVDNYGCDPKDIIVGIGPSIGPCCYEVSQDVIGEVKKVFGDKHIKPLDNGKGCFDLWSANKQPLIEAGVNEKNIEISDMCTICNNDVFFSNRYYKGRTGRFGAGIMLLD